MSGWGYEYLQDISYHTEGWKYEYVLGTFSELIAKHEAGEIDLMSSISYTPERAENLLYSTNPSGKKCYYVYVKPDRGDLTVGDPEALRGKTIGVNPDVLQTTEGKAWLAERGIDVTYKEYATGGEVFSALSSGEVDAIIMNDVLSSDDAMPVFYVGESDYYFTVPKSRPDIMAELDAAMAQILTSNPHYNDEFKARYSAINVGSSSLTDRERDWLASCDNTVTVGYLDNLRPYSLRGKDNQMEGALSAVVSDMRERFGITVNERAYSSNSDSEAALGRGEIDVAPPVCQGLLDRRAGRICPKRLPGLVIARRALQRRRSRQRAFEHPRPTELDRLGIAFEVAIPRRRHHHVRQCVRVLRRTLEWARAGCDHSRGGARCRTLSKRPFGIQDCRAPGYRQAHRTDAPGRPDASRHREQEHREFPGQHHRRHLHGAVLRRNRDDPCAVRPTLSGGYSLPVWPWRFSTSWRFLRGRCFARAKRSRKHRPRAVRKPRSSRA